MTILVAGGQGRLGRAIALASADVMALGRDTLDITASASVIAALERFRPAALINCAAMTDVDACERDPEHAHRVNGTGAGTLARACAERDVRLIHISTDYVFSAQTPEPIRTEAARAPIQTYGASKAAGEEEVLAAGGEVARVSWLFDDAAGSFPDRLFTWARGGNLRLAADQISRPTSVYQTARQVLVRLARPRQADIMHLGGGPPATRFDYAKAFIEVWRAMGLDLGEPARGCLADFPALAPRPLCSVLAVETDGEDWRRDVEPTARAIAQRHLGGA